MTERLLWGKYRGVVTKNYNPDPVKAMPGCLRAKVKALGDLEVSWALPSVPYAGDGVGLFMLPPVGANVWIEFEGGRVDRPVWSGCFWDPGQCPVTTASPTSTTTRMLKTDTVTVTIEDIPPGVGTVTIETKMGMKVKLSAQGIEITTGQGATVELQGPRVQINGTALEVI